MFQQTAGLRGARHLLPMLLAFCLALGIALIKPSLSLGARGEGTTMGRGVTLRFDDVLLLLLGLGVLGHMAISGGGGRVLRTPVNRPIMLYSGETALAVPAQSPEALAHSIAALLADLVLQRERRDGMTSVSVRFGWDAIVTQYEACAVPLATSLGVAA